MRVYHVAPESKTEEIQQVGIKPTDAPECRCGMGVHICEKKLTAEMWADWLKFERETYTDSSEDKYRIWSITDVKESELIKDEFEGDMFKDDSWILCTEDIIPTERIKKEQIL